MDNKTTFKRGDMFYADMPQGVGSEQSGYRPVIILQNDVGNKHSTTVIVAPLTSVSHAKAKLPTHYTMKAESGLEKPSIVLLEQIHTIDKQRLQKYIGKASDKALAGIEYSLAISLGFIDPVTKTTEIGLCGTCKDLLSHAGAFSIEGKKITCACSRCGFPKGTVYKVKQKGGL